MSASTTTTIKDLPVTNITTTGTVNPPDSLLCETIENMIITGVISQTTGVEKFKAAVKADHPSWNVTSKSVRVCLKKVIEEMNKVDGEFGVQDRMESKAKGQGPYNDFGECPPYHFGYEEPKNGGGNRAERRKKEKDRKRFMQGKFPTRTRSDSSSSGDYIDILLMPEGDDSFDDGDFRNTVFDFGEALRGPVHDFDHEEEYSALWRSLEIERGHGRLNDRAMITDGGNEDGEESYEAMIGGERVGFTIADM